MIRKLANMLAFQGIQSSKRRNPGSASMHSHAPDEVARHFGDISDEKTAHLTGLEASRQNLHAALNFAARECDAGQIGSAQWDIFRGENQSITRGRKC